MKSRVNVRRAAEVADSAAAAVDNFTDTYVDNLGIDRVNLSETQP